MARKEIKHEAQDRLLFGLSAAFSMAGEAGASEEVLEEMSRQMARVEKLFGYEPYSGGRGI